MTMYIWLCMAMYGYAWPCMPIYGYVWLCMYGYEWLYMAMYVCCIEVKYKVTKISFSRGIL